MRKRIFGSQLYATFEGVIEDVDGNQVPTFTKEGGNIYIKFPGNRTRSVTKLIAEAFIGVSKKKIVHLDGDRKNNAAWNLEYANHTSIPAYGYRSRYLETPVKLIKQVLKMIEDSIALDDISKMLNIPSGFIYYIINENKLRPIDKT